MHRLRHALHETFKSSVESISPARASSAYETRGVLTPEEFVRAGDALVRACPTWSWRGGGRARAVAPAQGEAILDDATGAVRATGEGYGGVRGDGGGVEW